MNPIPKLTDLTPERKRVLIAEALGFRFEIERKKRKNAFTMIFLPNGDRGSIKAGNDALALELALKDCVPDYTGSLDAMHEAEKVLSEEQWKQYCVHIFHSTLNDGIWAEVRATAMQRADAFLLVTGKAGL